MDPARRPRLGQDYTRRDFLARASAWTVGAALAANARSTCPARAGEAGQTDRLPVVRVRADGVILGRRVHPRLLGEMLEKGLLLVTGASSAAAAWRSLLAPEDVIGLKFNQSGAEQMGTTAPMADALITSLVAAGFKPAQLVPLEVPPIVYAEHGTARPTTSWDREETPFGSGSDRLAAVLRQVTAIINVPFLKTHNIAGLTCCLKNLSHGLIKHPARFHDHHCSPYIADIVALPQIRDKLRLHMVNALRIVYDGGPEAPEESTSEAGILLVSRDPVATDVVGLEEINYMRQAHSRERIDPEDVSLSYLSVAGKRGLGCSEIHDIPLQKVHM